MPSIDPARDSMAEEPGGRVPPQESPPQPRPLAAAAEPQPPGSAPRSDAAAALAPAAQALEAAAQALEAGELVAAEDISAISPGSPGSLPGPRNATPPSLIPLAAARPPSPAAGPTGVPTPGPTPGPAPQPGQAGTTDQEPQTSPPMGVLVDRARPEASRREVIPPSSGSGTDEPGNRRRRPGSSPLTGPGGQSGSGGPGGRMPRRGVAIALIAFSVLLILAAVGVGGYPFYTDIQAARHQKVLASKLAQAAKETGAARLKLLQQYQDRNFALGNPITKIIIPAININTVVVQGTSDEALNVGAGHYPQTPLPGDVGNVAIAGHRTMNGHPFGDLNKLSPGDAIILQTPFATYTYKIIQPFDGHANPWVVQPTDWSIIAVPTQDHLLTLTTCNPPGQQTTRLVVRAKLDSTTPA